MTNAPLQYPSPKDLDKAAEILRAGGLVAFPTETVYGLGADATNETAVARIFEAKGRPLFNPLISHVADAEAAFALGDFSITAKAVAGKFWPGPLTIVVKRAPECPVAWLTSAGLDSLALRVPAHPLARELLARTGRPIAAPSANRSGRISPTRAKHVASELGDRLEMILDGGACAVGLESTVVDFSGETATLLRPGAITREMLAEITGPVGDPPIDDPLVSPGMLASHYAPNCPVRLGVLEPLDSDAFLGFGSRNREDNALNLSHASDLAEAAANLFHMLRALDTAEAEGIAVAPIPEHGLGAAINDRLRRAAAPR
ncbi:MAG: L-threonylcarbamoyladenylate synthase [Alphaproteobacteria bacterium]|nr:L-threonylcarbamoyladenylate synthase [Alphaproteobacteria bacterium]